MSSATERNLLFGVLALQLDFITREQLVSGVKACVLSKDQSLAEFWQQAGILTADLRKLLDSVVEAHVRQHGSSLRRSLAACSTSVSLQDEVELSTDPQLAETMIFVAAARKEHGDSALIATGASTSDGRRFQILRPHAEGGLGRVYVARDSELNREVALKEIQPTYAHDPVARERFTLEAKVTGGLEHPGIVPVYGLGFYTDGRPFYAMRFVQGDSLKDAIQRFHDAARASSSTASERILALRQLLGRFLDVCQAVEYAHSRGVLHRDLKPANVMLGKYGETLVVDWGLAKPHGNHSEGDDGDTQAESHFRPAGEGALEKTRMGAVMGTMLFMSPEQAAGRLDLLGPAADVFALGATLYNLLTGQPPYSDIPQEARREAILHARFTPPRQLDGSIPQPLAAICLKAMACAREDRYASAAELVIDIEHWLADEPVAAYRESRVERLSRWRRGHPRMVAGLAAALLVGLLSVAGSAVILGQKNHLLSQANASLKQARDMALAKEKEAQKQRVRADLNAQAALAKEKEAQGQRDRADANARHAIAEQQRVRKSLDFLVAAFERSDPEIDGRDLKASDLLIAAAKEADISLAGEPQLQAEMLWTIGVTLRGLGIIDAALPAAKRSYELYRAQFGPDGPDTLHALNNLAIMYSEAGQLDEAIRLQEDALARMKQVLGPDDLNTLKAMANLSTDYKLVGRSKESLLLREKAYQKIREKLGADHPDTLDALASLATDYGATGRLQEAISLLESVVEKRQLITGVTHPDTIRAVNNLANAYLDDGRTAPAVSMLEKAFAVAQEKLGPDHPLTLQTQNNLARAFAEAGRSLDAMRMAEDHLQRRRAKSGINHPATLMAINNLASIYCVVGKFDDAEVLLEESLRLTRARFGAGHRETQAAAEELGKVRDAARGGARMIAALETNLKTVRAQQGPEHLDTYEALNRLAIAYGHSNQIEKALPLYQEMLEIRKKKFGERHPATIAAMNSLGLCYSVLNRFEEALPLYEAALKAMQSDIGPDHIETIRTQMLLGEARMRHKDYPGAEEELLDAHAHLLHASGAWKIPLLRFSTVRLVELYEAWQKPAELAKWQQELESLKKGEPNVGDAPQE
jgi:serine/threonine protein kinase